MPNCTKCKTEKLPEQMSVDRSRKNGLSSWCKDCRKISARIWGTLNPDKVKTRVRTDREYYQYRDYILKYRYGISQEDYNKLLEQQDHACAICNRDSREMTYHLHTDHCHATGTVRGLLCSPCNVYLGYIKDNPDVYLKGFSYIKNTPTIPCHKKKTKEEK